MKESRWWFDMKDYYTVDNLMPDNLVIIRFENLVNDIEYYLMPFLKNELNLQKANQTKRKSFEKYITAELEPFIYQKYQWIFDKGFYSRMNFRD